MTAGAASRDRGHWHAIDWQQCHQHVHRLQGRIVKACQAGRGGKGQALQRLLTHAWSGRVTAVKRVTENPGKRTPGMDGTLWDTPEKQAQAIHTRRHRGYRPTPLRRVDMPKSNGKKRPLGIVTMQDRAMQVVYRLAVDPIAAETADPNSYGFRTARCTADAIHQCHTVLSNRAGAAWVLEGDSKACYDRINHAWLLAHVPMAKDILQKWLTAGCIENSGLNPTEVGGPQGGPRSPVWAHLTLDGLEHQLREQYPKATVQSRRATVHLSRWADDFSITGSSKELRAHEVKPLVETCLKERGLELSPEKTSLTHGEAGFDLLGHHVRTYKDGTIILTPSAKNVKTFLGTVRQVIKGQAPATAGTMMWLLTPVIRGWAKDPRHVRSTQTFVTRDHAIFQALWRWARRRHPQKPQRWSKEQDFHHIEQRHWVVCGETEGRHGTPLQVRLWSAAQVKIKRHSNMHGEANPYDPAWEQYCEQRLGLKMTSELKGRRQLLHLWREHKGLCPVCDQKMTRRVKKLEPGLTGELILPIGQALACMLPALHAYSVPIMGSTGEG